MSDLIQILAPTGETIVAAIRNLEGQIYNTDTPGFEAYDGGNVSDYEIATSEQGDTGWYSFTFPVLAAGIYTISAHIDTIESDPLGGGTVRWDGSDLVYTSVPGDEMDLVDAPNATAVTAIQDGLAVPGDAMTLTEAYDAAKTAAQAGDEMDLESATITTIKSGLSTLDAAGVWAHGTRTLSSFGTLVADIVAAVWAAGTRTLTAFGFSVEASNMRGTDGAALASAFTSTRAGYLDKLNITGTLANTDNAGTFKADVSGVSTLDPAGVRAAVGMAAANLDTQMSAKPTAAQVRTEMEGAGTKLSSVYTTVQANLDAKVSEAGAGSELITDIHSRVMTNLDAKVSTIGGAAGQGDIWYPIMVTENGLSTGKPVPDADVWITTDKAGSNVIAGKLQTKANGIAWFMLEHSIQYYAFAQKSGNTFMSGVLFMLDDGTDYGSPGA